MAVVGNATDGDDLLAGDAANDEIIGAEGNDNITGGAGDDVVIPPFLGVFETGTHAAFCWV